MRKISLQDVRREVMLRLSRSLGTGDDGWEAERDNGELYWQDAEGTSIDIRNMTNVHLVNLYAYLQRTSGEGREAPETVASPTNINW